MDSAMDYKVEEKGLEESSRSVNTNELCETCQNIDLHQIFSEGEFLANIEFNSACNLCNFFIPEDSRFYPVSNYTLEKNGDQNFFYVVDKDSYWPAKIARVFPQEAKFEAFDQLRSWILDCQMNSKNSDSDSIDHALCREIGSSGVPHIYRVIDCFTKTVIVAPEGCQYLALSYVWGNKAVFENQNIEYAPKTIEDAIFVTIQLGFRYLWVDKYTIDQTNPVEVDMQINQMNHIYKNAVATIIDASGSDPADGLAGISVKRPFWRYSKVLGELNYPNVAQEVGHEAPDIYVAISTSSWATRGWTYQEALFSQRRIYFTKNGVLFDCASLARLEVATTDIPTNRIDSHEIWHSKRVPEDIFKMIEQYGPRELSHQDDIIRAFSGVLSAFRELNSSLYHHWGIPIRSIGSQIRFEFVNNLYWTIWPPMRRRKDFPSWSWTGWIFDRVSYEKLSILVQQETHGIDKKCLVTSIIFELQNGTCISEPELGDRLSRNEDLELISRFIILTTWSQIMNDKTRDDIRNQIQYRRNLADALEFMFPSKNGWTFSLKIEDQSFFQKPNVDDDFHPGMLWLSCEIDNDEGVSCSGLCILSVVENVWERFGRVQAYHRSSEWSDTSEVMLSLGASLMKTRLG